MLKLEECSSILSSTGHKYSDEEVRQIQELLCNMAGVVFDINQKENSNEGDKEV